MIMNQKILLYLTTCSEKFDKRNSLANNYIVFEWEISEKYWKRKNHQQQRPLTVNSFCQCWIHFLFLFFFQLFPHSVCDQSEKWIKGFTSVRLTFPQRSLPHAQTLKINGPASTRLTFPQRYPSKFHFLCIFPIINRYIS